MDDHRRRLKDRVVTKVITISFVSVLLTFAFLALLTFFAFEFGDWEIQIPPELRPRSPLVTMGILIFVSLVFGLFFSAFISTRFLKPVNELKKMTSKVAKGDFTVQMVDIPENEFGEFIDVHKVNVAVVKDKSESVGMSVFAEPPPNAFESLATDAKTATHKGRFGSLNGDVHAVQLDVGTYIIRSFVVNLALDAVVVAERPFLVDAVVLGGGDFEVLDVDVFHVFVFLSFDVLSIHYKTGFVNYFFYCS